MALVSMNFGPQNCGAVPGRLPHDQVRRGWSKIIKIFQWVLIFEQSVNHRRGPRWWPQIGAAATSLRGVAERLVVLLKPGNAGGGKGPQFKTDATSGEGPGDWAT